MLSSILGIRLLLWTGGTIPTPVPMEVLESLLQVDVTNDAEQGDGFQMTFSIGKGKLGEFGILSGGSMALFNRVWLTAIFGVTPEVLIDGIITHHQLSPGSEPGSSVLTVTGKDVSVMLDLEEKNMQYPNQPDSVIVLQLIAAYATYGLIPQVAPTTDVPIEIQRIPRQAETDLKFIRRLAERNGFVFYIEPVTTGVNTAYWGPEIRTGLPQPALSLDMGPDTNVKRMEFANDSLAPVAPKGTIFEPMLKLSIPLPSLPSLRIPPLVTSPAEPRRTTLLRNSASKNPAEGATAAVAASTRAPDAVTANGELDGVRFGHVLRARKLVGVRGAGTSYNGDYYVRRVTHMMRRGEYTQQFTISREGTGALLPIVRP